MNTTSSSRSRSGSNNRRRFRRDNNNSGSRPRRRNFNRGSKRGGKGKRFGQKINPNMFINRNPVAEQTAAPVMITHKFTDFGFTKKLEQVIAKRNYVTPTPIQDQTIPHVMQGRDVIGLANTGTGKTAAFLLPMIERTLRNRQQTTLILAPTRELAQQIYQEFREFTPFMQLYATVCVGGTNIRPQVRNLKRHQHFIIGTPGRVIDLIKQGAIKPNTISNVVLDEADRMLDMGFINDMRFILERMPTDRNTLFFSATMSDEIKNLVHQFLTDPVIVSVIVERTSQSIEQDIVKIDGRDKIEVLKELLIQDEFNKVIVFGRTKYGVDKLSRKLYRDGITSESIHGNKSQAQRQRALTKFKSGKAAVLVATDVAARGIDVPAVTHVINYDVPATYDDYVHRIGRTGRGGQRGKALTFVD